MEGFVHNMNSMNSRSAGQVPFTSVNYGTDTSREGRLITRSILLATERGLGKGETPIFPIQIFRVKEGINYNPEDPNYDLLELACRVTSKRLFPNFAFQDASYNLEHYIENDPESEIAYMGCVDGVEVITYKIEDELYVESFERAWDRLSQSKKINKHGMSDYIDLENVTIYDSNEGGFVNCNRMMKNPDKGDWYRVKFNNGRTLLATGDHPLPLDRGRTYVQDIVVGDKGFAVWNQYSENTKQVDLDYAWILGLILCDGAYSSSLAVSLGADEEDILEKYVNTHKKHLNLDVNVIHRDRGRGGRYIDAITMGSQMEKRDDLKSLFGGVNKDSRNIPSEVFSWTREAKLSFMCGMIDADGYVSQSEGRGSRIQIGTVNRELAIQQLLLAQSIGLTAKLYLNQYNSENDSALRYRVEFTATKEMKDYLASEKKIANIDKEVSMVTPESITVVESELLGHRGRPSYDVTTDSDRFDVSGIQSHNCRTRVLANVNGREIVEGRGNLSFTTVNLVKIALLADRDIDKFYKLLDEQIVVVKNQLLERYKFQISKQAKNFKFLMGEGVWMDSEKLSKDDTLEDVLKHGSLSMGFIGLAEALVALTGEHHGESEDSFKLGHEIISYMRDEMDRYAKEYKLNFTLLGTPSEGTAGKYVVKDREEFGSIKGVTDRDYYSNSFHIPVYYNIGVSDKIEIEGQFHGLCNAGHITYVELDGNASKNPEAIMQIVRTMKESEIGYGSINHPVDRCPICGFGGIIGNKCPECHVRESDGVQFERIRRITGYLVGTMDRWNSAKKAEEKDRVKHGQN